MTAAVLFTGPSQRATVTVASAAASCMGHSRRSRATSRGPAASCQTLVTKEGRIKTVAASDGGINSVRNPIATVGNPMPIAPLTNPARTKTRAIAAVGPRASGMHPM